MTAPSCANPQPCGPGRGIRALLFLAQGQSAGAEHTAHRADSLKSEAERVPECEARTSRPTRALLCFLISGKKIHPDPATRRKRIRPRPQQPESHCSEGRVQNDTFTQRRRHRVWGQGSGFPCRLREGVGWPQQKLRPCHPVCSHSCSRGSWPSPEPGLGTAPDCPSTDGPLRHETSGKRGGESPRAAPWPILPLQHHVLGSRPPHMALHANQHKQRPRHTTGFQGTPQPGPPWLVPLPSEPCGLQDVLHKACISN